MHRSGRSVSVRSVDAVAEALHEELEKGCLGARILAGNDYEFGMLAEKLGITEAELQRKVPITVMTRGEAGSMITVGDEKFEIPAAKCEEGR